MGHSNIIFFDIDGTLIGRHHKTPNSTLEALHQLQNLGFILCISTGRSLSSLKNGHFVDEIEWDGYVCNNGQMVYDKHLNLLFSQYIDESAVKEMVTLANTLLFPVMLEYENHNIMTLTADDNVKRAHEFFHSPIEKTGDYEYQNVIMAILYSPLHYDYQAFKKIAGITIFPGMSSYADIVKEGSSKHVGIQELLKHYHQEQYIAFGDSLNDIDMLQHAKIAIAMGQGHDELKAVASFVTQDVDEDGILHACQHFDYFQN